MPTFLLSVFALYGFADVGPLDGFRANYAAIKVEGDFRIHYGWVDRSAIARDRLWSESIDAIGFEEAPRQAILGQWACDGKAEYYYYSSPEDVILEEQAKRPEDRRYNGRIEVIFDGETQIGHSVKDPFYGRPDVVNAWATREPGLLSQVNGPFMWWWHKPFIQTLMVEFERIEPTRKVAIRGGHVCDLEIYRRFLSTDEWDQFEIYYDASIGCLPRYARRVNARKPPYPSVIYEMRLLEATACAAGGFLPTSYYVTTYSIANFITRYKSYDDKTVVFPLERVYCGIFRFERFQELSTPLALKRLDGVRILSAIGGQTNLPQPLQPLTIAEAKSLLGDKLMRPRSMGPNLDLAELAQYKDKPGRGWIGFVTLAVLLCAVACVVLIKRNRAFGLLIFCPVLNMSCSRVPAQPVVKLSLSFSPGEVLYNLKDFSIPLSLNLRNEGNVSATIYKIDGGCSCRQVEESVFPVDLAPNSSLSVAIKVNPKGESGEHIILFTLETNHGSIKAPSSLVTFPKDQLTPDSFGATLSEHEDWSFDLVHRRIIDKNDPGQKTVLHSSPRFFTETIRDSRSGTIANTRFRFEDTCYRIKLSDLSIGLHREPIALLGADFDNRFPIDETIVSWRRLSFLSTVPDRIYLASKPTRVFLRCLDDNVEFTRVLSSPKGVHANVVETKEVTIRLAENAPDVIDGFIEVGTTAKGRPPLKVPVVRYAPKLKVGARNDLKKVVGP